MQITRRAVEALSAYHWPGNVRELENALERAIALCDGEIIQAHDLPPSLLAEIGFDIAKGEDATATLPIPADGALFPLQTDRAPVNANDASGLNRPVAPLKTFLRQQEQAHLDRALGQCAGDKEKAATLLGVSLATLYRKLSGEDKEF